MIDRTSTFGVPRLSRNRPLMAKGALLVVTTAVAATALTGAVLATPASGTLSSTILARAGFVERVDIKFKVTEGNQEVIQVPDARDTVIQQVVLAPGGQSGWHSHPGPVVVLVKSGEMTFYDGESAPCTTHTYVAGQAFIDRGQGHIHLARNLSTTSNAELWFTYFDVPPGATPALMSPIQERARSKPHADGNAARLCGLGRVRRAGRQMTIFFPTRSGRRRSFAGNGRRRGVFRPV
jgi:quercetin dioxygenase-like cupin family protein